MCQKTLHYSLVAIFCVLAYHVEWFVLFFFACCNMTRSIWNSTSSWEHRTFGNDKGPFIQPKGLLALIVNLLL